MLCPVRRYNGAPGAWAGVGDTHPGLVDLRSLAGCRLACFAERALGEEQRYFDLDAEEVEAERILALRLDEPWAEPGERWGVAGNTAQKQRALSFPRLEAADREWDVAVRP